jgi:ABC-2 type transport system permease protein
MSTQAPSATQPSKNTSSLVWLVAEREIGSKLRSKTFLISTGILLLVALAGVLIGGFASTSSTPDAIAATSQTASAVKALPNVTVTEVGDRAEAEKLVLDEKVRAAVLPAEGDPTGVVILAKKDAPSSLVMALSASPQVEILQPATTDSLLRYLVAIGFGVVFLMAASTFGRAPTTDAVCEVAATASGVDDLLAKPPISTPASATSSRMPVEIMNALLRSLEPISRSATSQTADAVDCVVFAGRGVLTG